MHVTVRRQFNKELCVVNISEFLHFPRLSSVTGPKCAARGLADRKIGLNGAWGGVAAAAAASRAHEREKNGPIKSVRLEFVSRNGRTFTLALQPEKIIII